MTTDNNNEGVYPTPEIMEQISELINNANAMSLGDDNVVEEPDEPDENLPNCSNCGSEIDTESVYSNYHEGRLRGDRQNYRDGFGSTRRMLEDHELIFCDECYFNCEECGDSYHTDDSYTVHAGRNYATICTHCYRREYSYCARCDETFHSDDLICVDVEDSDEWADCYVCGECEAAIVSSGPRVIHDYTYQPPDRHFWVLDSKVTQPMSNSIRFAGVASIPNLDGWYGYQSPHMDIESNKYELFMGAELETNNATCSDLRGAGMFLLDAVRQLSNSEGEPYLYLKQDGSISGFEIVTMPATLEAHKVMFPGDAIRALGEKHGLCAWKSVNGTGAGIHIHVSKAAFSHSHLHKFQMFHYRNQEWLKRFAGRDSDRWASFDVTSQQYGDPCKLSDLSKGNYDHHSLRRYHALNFVPRNTVELRYFRSSLRPETVMSIFELVHAMWRYTKIHSSRDIYERQFQWGEFRSWVADQPTYEFLVPTMDRRSV